MGSYMGILQASYSDCTGLLTGLQWISRQAHNYRVSLGFLEGGKEGEGETNPVWGQTNPNWGQKNPVLG